MMRYLVTGGAGFIGSHIVERLIKEGNFVRILDNFSSAKKENLIFLNNFPNNNYEIIEGDIRNSQICFSATKDIDFVLHQAALRSVPKSLKNPYEYNEVNIGGTLNMLEASLRNKVKCFVFASSSSIYGEAKKFPQKETDLAYLISPYALTKLAGEHYCRIFSLNYKLHTVCLRYFNVFGPRQSLDDEYAVVIPKFIHCLLNNQPYPVYGTGRQSRDFTYIENVVEANLLAIKRMNRYKPAEVFNIANGKNYTILQLIKTLNRISQKDIKPIFLEKRPGDVFKTHADIKKAKLMLGYNPKVGFEEGLKKTLDYFKKIWQNQQ